MYSHELLTYIYVDGMAILQDMMSSLVVAQGIQLHTDTMSLLPLEQDTTGQDHHKGIVTFFARIWFRYVAV